LDDNHLLTLPTGERISFGTNVNFIFETADLVYASPATVSRMGMIFLNNEDLPIKSIVQKWLSTVQELKITESFMENYFYSCLEATL
jgi:dynein heavy chain 2